jgi:hypothetical protein
VETELKEEPTIYFVELFKGLMKNKGEVMSAPKFF